VLYDDLLRLRGRSRRLNDDHALAVVMAARYEKDGTKKQNRFFQGR
jgi:hypothetical protein